MTAWEWWPHFLRPHWLWALLLLPAALAGGWYKRRRRADWRAAIDPHLLPHLLEGGGRQGVAGWLALSGGLLLAVLALAGPSWRQIEQPVWETKAPLVIVLDLSSRSNAADLPPSRLLQARAKLAALLRERKGGEVALVAYAGEPFTVAPLTADVANVALFLDALSPEVMPVDGQRTDKALAWAADLLQRAGAGHGDILLLSDHADAAATAQAARIHASGHRVLALGLGTPQGAAYRTHEGRIDQAALDEGSLRALAAAGGGRYTRITAGDADLLALGVLQPRATAGDARDAGGGRHWQDQGFWLLPPLLLLALLAFRRPARRVAVLALGLSLPLALPARAAEPGNLWQRSDQRAHQRLAEGVDAYRKGDFADAQRRFEGIDNAQGWYNLGNALARQGRFDDAIDAYDHALRLQPDMADAKANRAAVEAARKQQPQQQKPQQGEGRQNPSSPQQPDDAAGQPQDPQAGQPPDGQPSSTNPQRNAPPAQGSDKAGQQRQQAPQAEDAARQQQADQAQRERMAEAMRQAQQDKQGDGDAGAAQAAGSAQERERRQALEAWMQRVPDEPGELLKAKFRLEYERRRREGR